LPAEDYRHDMLATSNIVVLEKLTVTQLYFYVMGHAVAQLIEALRFKPERHGFCSRWRHYSRTMVLGSTKPVTEISTRIISWGRGRVKVGGSRQLTQLSCVNFLELCETQGLSRLVQGGLTIYLYVI
jgi:hypothetical protein